MHSKLNQRLCPDCAATRLFLCSKHSLKNFTMTLGSCRVKKEDDVGAGPQNMFVNLFLMAQYAGQSKTNWCSSSAEPETQKTQWRCSLGTCCVKGKSLPVSTWRPWHPHLNLLCIFFPACLTPFIFFLAHGNRFGRSHKSLLEAGKDEEVESGMLSTSLRVMQQVHQSLFQASMT